MAEERDPVTGGVADETGEIREEIARTRDEMSNTISEIQDRLTPEHLIQQAKDSVQEAAAEKVRTIMHTANDTTQVVAGTARRTANTASSYVRQHPVQVALIATGVTWQLTRNSQSEWQGTRSTDHVNDWRGADMPGTEGYVAQAKDKTREVASQVRDVAATTTSQIQQRWRRAGDTSQRWITDNPLAVGVAAIAAGVAVGLAVPRTRLEDRTLGETRDSMVEMAGDAARDLRETVAEKAREVADEVMGGTTPAPSSTSSGTPSATNPASPGGRSSSGSTFRPI